ncbi:hypothetical protein B0H17DRAFT_1020131 [Mycena rosella]|uniref:WW domain-containing protein n=1 Tax=Mycena rosella TaxID=1033263 RepID=A0AAD7CTT0_MYCRO|nr:hypothetical protein B0H17DRAFT_1020131 [Mycena rosella]
MDVQKSSEFPGYQEKAPGTLRPVTSHGTGRYDTSILVEPRPRRIPAGLFTVSQDPEPEYLPPLWSAHVHPEGQLYFYRDGSLRVVTEAYLYRTETVENVCLWIDRIQEILCSTNTAVSRDIELFIKLEDDDCAYYFIDHANRTQFWLETSGTEELGLPPVISISQLKIVLEELYWIHVEHFPMHLQALSPQALDEIIGIFSHGLCDQMTSRVSTFLYTVRDCKAFVTILQGCRGNMNNGHTTWIIARLWSIIDHNKYITHYGQEHSRLSRDQAILFDPEQKHCWISTIMAALTFKTSDRHLTRLDDVFVDHIVYVDQWERLISDCLREWRRSAYGALSGLRLHLPFLAFNAPSPALLAVSVAAFGAGLASSIVLAHKYEPMEGINATEAMYYLETVQSPVFKFQPLAFAFSLPTALRLWGFVLFLSNCALLIAEYLGWKFAVGLVG